MTNCTMEEMMEALHRGVVHFRYVKNGGEEREAYGTLNMDCIPESQQPRGQGRRSSDNGTVTYYDIFSKGWRVFHPDRVLLLDGDYGD